MTAALIPKPHARQSEIDALRAKLMGSEAISRQLGIHCTFVCEALAYHDAALPAFLRLAAKGLAQKVISEKLGITCNLGLALLNKMPADIIAKVHAADRARRAAVKAAGNRARKHKTPKPDKAAVRTEPFTRAWREYQKLAAFAPRYDSVQVSM